MSASMKSSMGLQNPSYSPTEDSTYHDLVKDTDGLSTLFVSGTDIWAGGELAVPEVTKAAYNTWLILSLRPANERQR